MSKWNPFAKPEEKAAESQSKTEAEQLIETLGATLTQKFEETVRPLREEVTKLQTRWNEIEEAAKSEPIEPPAERTAEQKIEERQNQLLALTVQTNARITEAEILTQVAQKWPALVAEVKDVFDKTPISRKGLPDYASVYCPNVVWMVVGRAAEKGGLSQNRENGSFYIGSNSGKAGADGGSSLSDFDWVDPVTGRTESGEETLRKLGISTKDFEESRKRGLI